MACAIFALGCAASSPVTPDPGIQQTQAQRTKDDPHRLWGEYSLFINEAHDRVDVVPRREARFHLNALKFLESYCSDCLKITGIKNNGDGTIDLTVQITHPFNGFPQYTGFDVKGIIMFNGSHVLFAGNGSYRYELPENPRVSWRLLGDPELLNADGYIRRWAPSYDSGSDLPIFNYWPGKYSSGAPTADVNAYLNFYTDEERHMFRADESAERTYHIWLPPGPVVAGYAVEACWEPQTVTPVTNPLTDFPSSANQPEPYHLKWVINNGDPIKAYSGCCHGSGDCQDGHVEINQWPGIYFDIRALECPGVGDEPACDENGLEPCNPSEDNILSIWAFGGSSNCAPGQYQWLYATDECYAYNDFRNSAYTILEFEVIE